MNFTDCESWCGLPECEYICKKALPSPTVSSPPIEVRVIPDEQFTSWTVEGWRSGERLYTRLFNRTADEAWHYGAEWMRQEMTKAKETK